MCSRFIYRVLDEPGRALGGPEMGQAWKFETENMPDRA